MAPKWSQNAAKMGLGGYLEGSKICSGGLWHLGGLLESSGRPPEPKKSALDSLLGAPRRIPRQFSAILGPKVLPKGVPKLVQNGVQKRFELKAAKSQNFEDVS